MDEMARSGRKVGEMGRGRIRDRRTFPVGYYRLHEDPSLNYQANRWVQWLGKEALTDMRPIMPKIRDYADWKREFFDLAERALSEKREFAAGLYFSSAGFFMLPDDPDRAFTRRRFLELTRRAYGVGEAERQKVPYEDGFLPAYRFTVEESSEPKGTVVLFGGYDSWIEEFFPVFPWFTNAGYEVVAFEGPGQGDALEESGLPMTPEWERPVSTVLDHFGLSGVTLVGVSLGGGLAVRAAAFERRVERVVAWDVLFDLLECVLRQTNPAARALLRALFRARAEKSLNEILRRVSGSSLLVEWGLRRGMHVLGAPSSYGFLREASRYTTAGISSRVECDVLLLAGREDHYVPLSQFYRQAQVLTNASSLTGRIFGRAEHAENHCQVGNMGLVIQVILEWLEDTGASPARRESLALGGKQEVEEN